MKSWEKRGDSVSEKQGNSTNERFLYLYLSPLSFFAYMPFTYSHL